MKGIDIKQRSNSKIISFLRSQDSHGHPIELTFDG